MPSVINLRDRPGPRAALANLPEHDGVVRIDRKSRWGNPFRIGPHGNREEVIRRYRRWL